MQGSTAKIIGALGGSFRGEENSNVVTRKKRALEFLSTVIQR